MAMRIAWACHPRNIRLGIAAQVFVYAGTIILFFVNWFLTQRVVRAQHPRWGWSQPYRIVHRAALLCLILCLLMIIVGSIQQFFTLDATTLRVDRYLQLTGQTYFAAFCFAPIVLVLISFALPRKGTEKFGAGRLRNNIAILLFAVTVLSIGAIFRCVIAWLPPTPTRNAQGKPISAPWYYSKACFYVFNFTTEIIVVIFYAVTRIDLRFHIPDGSRGPGAYRAGRESKYNIDIVGNEKNLKRASTQPMFPLQHPNGSSETIHEYETSLFDDSHTLADSLRYPSSVLEVDEKTGHWKIRRMSRTGSISTRMSQVSEPSLWSPDRDTVHGDGVPPVPTMHVGDWPLRESQLPRGSIPVMEHKNRRRTGSGGGLSNQSHELRGHDLNGVDMGNAIEDAIAKLEANSEVNKERHSRANKDQPPDYEAITPLDRSQPTTPKNTYLAYKSGADIPPKHTYQPSPLSASELLSPELPKKHDYAPPAESPTKQHNPESPQESEMTDNLSFNTAEEDFARFSFEAPPRRGEEGYDGSGSESESQYERRSKE